MKKETALKRIKNAVEKRCPCESEGVKNYIAEITYLTFVNLELDEYEDYTCTENLKFAIEVNLYDELNALLREARNETEK